MAKKAFRHQGTKTRRILSKKILCAFVTLCQGTKTRRILSKKILCAFVTLWQIIPVPVYPV